MQSKSNVRFACIGDLVADYYYSGTTLINVDGGRSKFNDLANLGKLGNECVAFSCCSASKIGEMLCYGLLKCNVNVEYVQKLDCKSRIYNLIRKENGEYQCTKYCPICGKLTWYDDSISRYSNMQPNFKPNDVFIFDSVKPEDMENIYGLKNNDILLDLGNSHYLQKLSDEELKRILKTKFEIIQINEKVANYLTERFKLKSCEEIFKLINCKFLIVTLGSKGAYFLTETMTVKEKLKCPATELDTLGAGDAFFSTFIDAYYRNEKTVDNAFVEKNYQIATKITSIVVQREGGRGHLYPKIKIRKKKGICVCQDFEIQSGR